MNRGYSREEYLAKIAALRAARPDLLITGDMIIGFPGETEADFAQTLALMEAVRYADLFYFVYSARPGTKAAEFPELLDAGEKQARLEQLQTLQRQLTLECNQALLGTQQQLLVEGVSRRGDQLYGRTGGNRVVNFTGDPALIGGLVTVAVTEAFQNSLQGSLVRSQEPEVRSQKSEVKALYV
jgi:tRNA-2-methylthio-N6-dimethylallyladenosine synthase